MIGVRRPPTGVAKARNRTASAFVIGGRATAATHLLDRRLLSQHLVVAHLTERVSTETMTTLWWNCCRCALPGVTSPDEDDDRFPVRAL
jgi:hypothetical protein